MDDGTPTQPTNAPASAPATALHPAQKVDDLAETFADEDGTLTRLHPNHRKHMRLEAGISAAVVSIVAFIANVILPVPPGVIVLPVIVLATLLVWRMPHRRFSARGYSMDDKRLRVVRGIWFRSDTVVPFGRVQHIDVDRGPLERFFGLATITLHTAGTHNASVKLPGLAHDRALAIREEIRAHIKRETL